jgi:NADH-quinone oxidoreductase subunit N
LFGICLIYGAMGTFDVTEISDYRSLLNCQFGWNYFINNRNVFKIAGLPFWAPDVYEGSPALTTALMSTLAKL